jgi:hypothetical protein
MTDEEIFKLCGDEYKKLYEENGKLKKGVQGLKEETLKDVVGRLDAENQSLKLQVEAMRGALECAKNYCIRLLANQGVPSEDWGLLSWHREIDEALKR